MKKTEILIPDGIFHLSDCENIQSQFPQGSFILDKTITGCGATTMFLSDDTPTILCCARLELMHCKANSPRFIGKVHEFRKFGDRSSPVIDLINSTKAYIGRCNSPFSTQTEKILVSYDSFKHVAQALAESKMLDRFRVVVDEMQTMFTDSSFKGVVEIEFLEALRQMNNVVFVSATPYIEYYLDAMGYFNGLPYVELVWPPSSIHCSNIEMKPYLKQSPRTTAKKIIDGYRASGYFMNKMVGGKMVYSDEAVFYINDVSLILDIAKDNALTPLDTNIICAVNEDNRKRLKNKGFEIGHAPQEGKPHKTFTFVTKCAFEGVDFYSPCAYTYIFSNINIDNLALDISLDLPQIMGRQRLGSNLFRYDATFYYKTMMDFDEKNELAFRNKIQNKANLSKGLIENYNKCDEAIRFGLGDVYRSSQQKDKFSKNYVAVIDDTIRGSQRVVFNELAMFNEIRAWDIQKSQYANGCQVMRSIEDSTKSISDDPRIQLFLKSFIGSFENKMEIYCQFLNECPDCKELLEWLPQIPSEMKIYYNTLGPDRLRSLSYKEANIRKEIDSIGLHEITKQEVAAQFVQGQFYTLKDVKHILQCVYSKVGVRETAKASDLKGLIACNETQRTIDGHRENGYVIL